MNSHALQVTSRITAGSEIVAPVPRILDASTKTGVSVGRTVALFVATVAIAVNSSFGLPPAAAPSPDSVAIETFPVGNSPIGLAFDGANIWTTDDFGNALIKVRASDGVVLGRYGIERPFFV